MENIRGSENPEDWVENSGGVLELKEVIVDKQGKEAIQRKAEDGLPSYVSMYEISGQDPITEHSFNRYIKDKKQDRAIKEVVEESVPSIEEKILKVTEENWTVTMEQGLDNENVEVQLMAAEKVFYAPKTLQKEATVLQEKILSKIKEGLANPDINTKKQYVEMIAFAPKEAKDSLKKTVSTIINEGLDSQDVETQKTAASMIGWAPETDFFSLIEKGLSSENIDVQKEAADKIGHIEYEKRKPLTEMVSPIVKQGLNDPDIKVQKTAANMIWYVPTKEEPSLRKLVVLKVRNGLTDASFEVRKMAAEMISYVAGDDMPGLITEALNNPHIEVQKIAIKQIECAPTEKRIPLCKYVIEKGLGNELVESYPIARENISGEKLSRKGFAKTGSGTTLLGGELKGKAMIRHIKPEAFLTWQKVYEDYSLWQENGFDYVPIEPIYSYHLNKDGLVDVYSGVLDCNLEEWGTKWYTYLTKLHDKKEKIINVLKKANILHGHTHDMNFCLRFFRDEKGGVDFSKEPRIYLIDFDQALAQ